MPDTFDAARPPCIDSDDLARIARGLEDAVTTDMREAFEKRGACAMGDDLEAHLARDYERLWLMASYYWREADAAAAEEKSERRERTMQQLDWNASRGCGR